MSKESQGKKVAKKAARRAERKLPVHEDDEAPVDPTEDELEELDSGPSTSE